MKCGTLTFVICFRLWATAILKAGDRHFESARGYFDTAELRKNDMKLNRAKQYYLECSLRCSYLQTCYRKQCGQIFAKIEMLLENDGYALFKMSKNKIK